MNENDDNYNINGNLNENIIQTETTDAIVTESSFSIQDPNNNNMASIKKSPTQILSEVIISSIIPQTSTTNDILGVRKEKNKDIIIFEIKGQNLVSQITWKIYKTNKQIRDLFNQTRKEMIKINVITDEITKICKTVTDYTDGEIYKNLDKIANNIIYLYNKTYAKQCTAFKEGLNISSTSFIYENNGVKPFEGYAYKKAEPRCMRTLFKIFCLPLECCIFKSWNKRWVVLKEDMICYSNDSSTLVGKNVYWFDEEIEIRAKDDTSLEITNLSRSLILKFNSMFERDLWEKEINQRIERKIELLTNNEYQSFASQKTNCGAKWFVDGGNYFNYLYSQLVNANESVFITDWFLSPELALQRPINYDQFVGEKNAKENLKNLTLENASRLMDIFYLLAKRGVKIYILIFCEPSVALAINSLYTKRTLQYLHPNIQITRHPKGTKSILWSHHEKLVIIDQRIAFVGGVDLCWGRYDINSHPIVEEENKDKLYYYPGSDYINERQVDLHNVERFYIEQAPRDKIPRMAWHDIHTMVVGPIVSDVARHFIERWNDARFNRRNNGLVNVGTSFSFRGDEEIKKKKKNNAKPISIELQNKLVGKNFKNDSDDEDEAKLDDVDDVNSINQNENNVISTTVPKKGKEYSLNSSDDDLQFNDKSYDSDDAIEAFKKSNKNKNENKGRVRRATIFTSVKNKYQGVKQKFKDMQKKHGHHNKKKDLKQKAFFVEKNEQKDQSIPMDFKIQALRSVCYWSIGKKQIERSILKGYYQLIDNSKHYLYIENQFFITNSFSEDERKSSNLDLDKKVKNEIGLHIRSRIERAYEKKEKFKVLIGIPLLPGFSGTPGESSTMNAVLKHTYKSISNNQGMSLLELLRKKLGDEVDNYIYFFSLRNHGVINGVPVTELIYIHSKLLIVDDEKVLIGSANINDRSMKGNRDSEFAVIMEENKSTESIMDGNKFMASNYALTLRKHLMAEHLGINDNEEILKDPLSDNLWNLIKIRANMNTKIYREVFNCFPDDTFRTFNDLNNRKIIRNKEDEEKLKEIYDSKINNIVGHIVEYPTKFLIDEKLEISVLSKENLIPEKNFT